MLKMNFCSVAASVLMVLLFVADDAQTLAFAADSADLFMSGKSSNTNRVNHESEQLMTRDGLDGSVFRIVADIPYGDERLAYQVGVERGWAFTQLKGAADSLDWQTLTLIGRFFAGTKDDVLPPELRIRMLELKPANQHSALQWSRQHYHSFAVKVEAVNYQSDYIADLEVSFEAEGQRFKGRTLTKIVSNRLYLLECVAGSDRYHDISENCAVAFTTFAIRKPDTPILSMQAEK